MTSASKSVQARPTPLIWFWRDALSINYLGIEIGKRDLKTGKLKSVMIRGRRMIRNKDLESYIELLIEEEALKNTDRPQNKNLQPKAKQSDEPEEASSNVVSISGE
jgi:hypothetical protein